MNQNNLDIIQTKAIAAFQSGYNCAQAVVVAFSDKLGYDETLATEMACGFGGGMGRMQEKCGALTGAFMVVGIYNSRKIEDIKTRKNIAAEMVRRIDAKFRDIHHTTACRDLLQCDLKTEAGHDFAVQHKLFETVCSKCIVDTVGFVDQMITEK